MEVTKFVIDGNDVFVKDAQARDSITTLSDDVNTAQSTADRAEGKADEAQTVADRAEGKADEAQTVADRAEGKADDALEGLTGKQRVLNNGTFRGDIDTLVNDVDMNGYYFVHSTEASGTHPVAGYYMLLMFGSLQLAVTANSTTVHFYARTYVNSTWSYWRKMQLTT